MSLRSRPLYPMAGPSRGTHVPPRAHTLDWRLPGNVPGTREHWGHCGVPRAWRGLGTGVAVALKVAARIKVAARDPRRYLFPSLSASTNACVVAVAHAQKQVPKRPVEAPRGTHPPRALVPISQEPGWCKSIRSARPETRCRTSPQPALRRSVFDRSRVRRNLVVVVRVQ